MAVDKPKLSGMEMMMQSLMRAAGFDPTEIQAAMVQVVNDMRNGLQNLNDTVTRIETAQHSDHQLLIQVQKDLIDIREHLGISNANAEVLPLRLPKRLEN